MSIRKWVNCNALWVAFQSQPAPLLEFRSDSTTGTTALELPVPIPRTVRIATKIYEFLGGDDSWSCRLPCAAADSGRLASIFNLTGRLAPRYLRYSHLDQTPCGSCGVSQFSRRRRFLALPPLSSPLSPPLVRVASLRFQILLDGRHRGARVPRTDIKHHATHAVFREFPGGEDFSQRRRFLVLPSLSSPLSPPLVRVASPEPWIWLDDRHRGARVPRADIKRHADRAVSHDFFGGDDFWPCRLPYRHPGG